MRNRGVETKVINLKRRKLVKKYKALFDMFTNVKIFFKNRLKKPSIGKMYRKTINH